MLSAILLVAALAVATPEDDARAVLALAAVQPKPAPKLEDPPSVSEGPEWVSYEDFERKAARDGRPLVIFSGCKNYQYVKGVAGIYVESHPDAGGKPSVLIFLPDGAGGWSTRRRFSIGTDINRMVQEMLAAQEYNRRLRAEPIKPLVTTPRLAPRSSNGFLPGNCST